MNIIEKTMNTTDQEGYNLNVHDLNTLKNIIDNLTARGEFRPSEMAIIGQTYNKITAFLEQVAKQQELAA